MGVKELDLRRTNPMNFGDKCWIMEFKLVFASPSTALQLDKDGAIFKGLRKISYYTISPSIRPMHIGNGIRIKQFLCSD